jgi:hypothetical protein
MRHVSRVVVAATLVVALLAGCSRGKGKTEVRATIATTTVIQVSITSVPSVISSQSPSPSPSRESVVLEAYRRYWDAYGQAVLNLDPHAVQDVASGEELESITEEIESLRARGLAARVQVTHNPAIIELTDTTATLYDEMINSSFYVNAQTKEPRVGTGDGATLTDVYYLQRIGDGTWKVVSSGRQR